MSETFEIALTTALIPVLLGTGIQVWLNSLATRKFEKFKEDLRRETEVSIAQSNFRYSQVYKNMAEAISEVYFKLIDLREALGNFQGHSMSPEAPTFGAASKDVVSKLSEFKDFFIRNNIYIPEPTAKEIWNCYVILDSQYIAINLSITPVGRKEFREASKRIADVNMQLGKVLDHLRINFQNILGIPHETKIEVTTKD
jgi:hypothetical protein